MCFHFRLHPRLPPVISLLMPSRLIKCEAIAYLNLALACITSIRMTTAPTATTTLAIVNDARNQPAALLKAWSFISFSHRHYAYMSAMRGFLQRTH